VLKAGAGEIYFGIMPRRWIDRYGNADFISRRQNEAAHFSTCEELSEIVRRVNEYGCTATLVLNSRYSEGQLPHIFEILEQWEARGGHSVMVSDIEILIRLNDRGSRLRRQLSVMAGVFNSRSVAFFEQFGVSRIVLPREMSVTEMGQLVRNGGKRIEYEAIVMFQKCQFIDSFCNFYHPCNEKHGCQMEFLCNGSKVKYLNNSDFDTPFCAACSLERLSEAGVSHFKIAGRGYPARLVVDSIKFIRQAVDGDRRPDGIKQLYRSTFGGGCRPEKCYYQ